ncbi:hypothetical protein AO498_03950 [Algoriphagus sanaruensis]|uniref:Uncharacterized protein n=2 Tax=Algoriphagus sanaruensis TaxID=1727163 RepID=A0A142EK88_9BACT|nr:hypothetical protein AO498_03950 [Algoriphagus sanaruensis]
MVYLNFNSLYTEKVSKIDFKKRFLRIDIPNTKNQLNPLKPIKMRKLNKKELNWIKDNSDEFFKNLRKELLKVDTEIQLRKDELKSIATKKERIKRVSEIVKLVMERN